MTNDLQNLPATTPAKASAFNLTPQSLAEAKDYAKMISESELVPKDYRRKPTDILIAIQLGHELGLPPMQSLQSIAVINGRPAVYGDGLVAIVRASPLCEYLRETLDLDTMTASCTAKRRGDPEPQTRTFSQADAVVAKLWKREGPWTQYPQRMLAARARTFCLRDLFPDVLRGIAVREELEDLRHMGDAQRVLTEASPGSRAAAQPPDPPAPPKYPETLAIPTKPENGTLDLARLAVSIATAADLRTLEALGTTVDTLPRGSHERQTLVAAMKTRKARLQQADDERRQFVAALEDPPEDAA